MAMRFSMLGSAAILTAGLLALAACNGAETEVAADDTAEVDTADDEAAASQTTDAASSDSTPAEASKVAEASKTAAPAKKAATEESGLGEVKETVKTARCNVYDPSGDYNGPCQFTQWGGSSFTVSRRGNAEFFNDITEVVVEVDAPGVAGGSIRQNGELNYIGTMERHKDDRACWSSEDFTVCAY